MATQKPVIVPTLTAYTEVESLVDEGVRWGWARAHKHTDEPSAEQIQSTIVRYVMTVLAEGAEFRWSRARRGDQQD